MRIIEHSNGRINIASLSIYKDKVLAVVDVIYGPR